MSWAVRRRILYIFALTAFLISVVGMPIAMHFLSVPPTCSDGEQNQGETAPDKGGPCPDVDTNTLAPSSVIWTRSFRVREGSYSAVSYIQNPNDHAGIAKIAYMFSLYDSRNILVAERTGETYIMPGGITPVYERDIDTGHREATRAFFRFLTKGEWKHFSDTASSTKVTDRELTDVTTVPRLEATATNTDVAPRTNLQFIAVIFDTAGNAFASSATRLERLEAGESRQIVFTWPDPFVLAVGRVDIIPLSPPRPTWTAQ